MNKNGYILDHKQHYKTLFLQQELLKQAHTPNNLLQLIEQHKNLSDVTFFDAIITNKQEFYIKILIDASSFEEAQGFINVLTKLHNSTEDLNVLQVKSDG